ncbi:phage tail protein [Brevibacillus sp. SYSU BS000544]|uniref:phage tail protein n=1 Tax=Brevibacillus sp. SYSU BS000544 TaxID=3416443 RepID=UPI003CE50761
MDPYLGEIRLFAGSYAPDGWAICDGSSLPVNKNVPLYSIIGNKFGGDKNNFNLPDFRNRVPMCFGDGPGLTSRAFASNAGQDTVTLLQSQIPIHTHLPCGVQTQTLKEPAGAVWANSDGRMGANVYSDTADTTMNAGAIDAVGGSQAHNNMQPYLGLNFIIALQGNYPSKG